jgi:hypothetical protein
MKISEKQLILLIEICKEYKRLLQNICQYQWKYPELLSTAINYDADSLLIEIYNQQSNELKEIK